ncbi:glucose-1-phosphate cytidylyltransferase [Thermotalea metallivorans]|uniref:Glucose-1-phosphate cytidylyltransferase n=1 Tax=Thermotalea metallivorans TaxID=520762 RepID=A0A140L0H9_9FIRM|nr:glucose-1-phosphate cytidylyltransferase [Thermotalea metallivorans]KXG74054.1 Glucose-1-phosphate cytidylyltransferase [Thermotalea metallivorans]
MRVVILCGGKGTRMREITEDIPKPLAMIGDKPILWHIMKIYAHYGFDDFILLLGYKGDKIKEYFMDYPWKSHNFVLGRDGIPQLLEEPERWKITFIDTGADTMTGGRIQQARQYIGEETFLLTYGDGLANIDIKKLLEFHKQKGRIATVTGVSRKSQYGTLVVKDNLAVSFQEKSQIEGIINGGFFVFNKEIFDYLKDDPGCILEQEPMMNLVKDQQLAVYCHEGFWIAMDTYKDILYANEIWKNGNSLWKVW